MKQNKRSLAIQISTMFTDNQIKQSMKRTPSNNQRRGGLIMLWGSLAASGTGGLERAKGIMKSEDY
jgi:hypothetical protein